MRTQQQHTFEDAKNRERVGNKIGARIERFFFTRRGQEFTLDSLEAFVKAEHGLHFAGGSVSRIMRDMRLKGKIGYELVSRAHSLYRVTT